MGFITRAFLLMVIRRRQARASEAYDNVKKLYAIKANLRIACKAASVHDRHRLERLISDVKKSTDELDRMIRVELKYLHELLDAYSRDLACG